MKHYVFLAIASLVINVGVADQFSLRHDDTGKVFGPFSTQPDSKLRIGKTTFTVVSNETASPLLEALKSSSIPTFEVRFAHPADCVNLVQEMISRTDAGAEINLVSRNMDADPYADDPKRVTLALRNVPAFQVLTEICDQADLVMREENGLVIVEPKEN